MHLQYYFEAEHVNYESSVKNGDVDFSIFPGHPADPRVFDSYYLCKDEIYVVLPPDHPYNKELGTFNCKIIVFINDIV